MSLPGGWLRAFSSILDCHCCCSGVWAVAPVVCYHLEVLVGPSSASFLWPIWQCLVSPGGSWVLSCQHLEVFFVVVVWFFFVFFFLQLCYCCRAAVVWHGDTRMQTKISYVLSFFHFWQWPCPVTAGVSELKQADFLFKCICCLEELQSVSSLCKTGCPAACSRYTCCPCCLPFIVLDSNFLMVAATFLFEGIFLLLVE